MHVTVGTACRLTLLLLTGLSAIVSRNRVGLSRNRVGTNSNKLGGDPLIADKEDRRDFLVKELPITAVGRSE